MIVTHDEPASPALEYIMLFWALVIDNFVYN